MLYTVSKEADAYADYEGVVLFGEQCIYLCRLDGEACPVCLARHATDQGQPAPLDLLRAHYARAPFVFGHSLDVLASLPLLIDQTKPGFALCYDVASGTLDRFRLLAHPRCDCKRVGLGAAPFAAVSRQVGASLREKPAPDLSDLVGGLVSAEHVKLDHAGTVTCLTESRRNAGRSRDTCGGRAWGTGCGAARRPVRDGGAVSRSSARGERCA